MFGHQGGNRGKHLEKIKEIFSHLPDKEDQKDGGADEAKEGETSPDSGAGKVSAHGFPPKKQGFK